MKRYESKYAKCPFYHSEEQGKICCEGVKDKTSIHLAFEDSKEKRKYREEICSEDYEKCLLCHMLYSKYEEGGDGK